VEITRDLRDGVLDVAVNGRIDGYWADHLDRALAEAVRDGHHRIRLDCSKVGFISSAGIGILVKFHKELARINGAFHVANPSRAVSVVLGITRLAALLVEPAAAPAALDAGRQPDSRLQVENAAFEIFGLDAGASMTCRTIGRAAGSFASDDCVSLGSHTPTFAVGVGAFGDGFADCQARFGELVSVAGATAYQPADGTNIPDYLIATGPLASDVHVLHCLACEGPFSHLIRFETLERGASVGLTRVLTTCLDAAASSAIGIVIVAETVGLVGAALRRSPAEASSDADFFAHPGLRSRLSFTTEPAFVRGVALAAGVVVRGSARGAPGEQLRPIGADCVGHVHAAAFRFRPIRKGPIDLRETVAGLFEADQLLGVMHLLRDDRGAAGAGESEFVRGACWMAPLTDTCCS
jgi:anti-anti-sigma factor